MLRDVGTLAARVVIGTSFAAHGAQKAYGWFGGPGPKGAAALMESLGFKPGERYARAAFYTEMASGLAIALGLGGPLGPAGLASVMTVAVATVHIEKGFFAQAGGFELNLLYVVGAFTLANGGYGRFSLDAALGEPFADERLALPALLAGIASGLYTAGQRVVEKSTDVAPDGP